MVELNEAWPYSDTLLFEEFAWGDVGQNQSPRAEAFIAGDVDGIFAWQPSDNLRSRAKDAFRVEPVRLDNALIFGYHINQGIYDLPEVTAPQGAYDPITKEPEGWLVRKGSCYALDGPQNAQALRQGNGPIDYFT